MSDVSTREITVAAAPRNENSYVDWSAVLAGAVLATAISFVLFTFGGAIGLSLSSPYEGEGINVVWFAIAAGLWFVWVQVSSFMAGGYIAGRLRRRAYDATEHEADVRDGAHGLLVWATGALLGAVLTALTLGGTAATGSAEPGAATPAAVLETVTESAGAAVSADAEDTVGDAVAPQLTEAEEDSSDRARRLSVIAAFVVAASLAISAAAAFFAATLGGNHRDRNTVVQFFVRRPW